MSNLKLMGIIADMKTALKSKGTNRLEIIGIILATIRRKEIDDCV